MQLTYRALLTWPAEPAKHRRPSTFRAGLDSTLGLLEEELEHLGADEAILELLVPPSSMRIDGSGLKDSVRQPEFPGVVLSFDSMHGPLRYFTDVFEAPNWHSRPAWHENLRAIALGLKALRQLDRYGIGQHGEQYAGWKQLGSGVPMGSGAEEEMTVDEAAALLAAAVDGFKPQDVIDSPLVRRQCYRAASKLLHTDAGGDHEKFVKLDRAKKLLDAQDGGA